MKSSFCLFAAAFLWPEFASSASTTNLRRREIEQNENVAGGEIVYDFSNSTHNQGIFKGTQVSSTQEIPEFALLCFDDARYCGGCGGILITSNHVLTAAVRLPNIASKPSESINLF